MSKPKRHHYVPQFFLKAWGERLHTFNREEKRWFQSHTKDIAVQKNLYQLSDEIESSFITPYIDNFYEDIQFAQRNDWGNLSEKQKDSVFKFILLLDARNPKSIQEMKEGCAQFIPLLEKILNTGSDFEKNFLDGARNGVLILVLTAIQELGLNTFQNSGTSDLIFDKLKKIINCLEERKIWPLSYIKNFNDEDVFIDEFFDMNKSLLSSNFPIFRHGKYDESFSVTINISPEKAYFISNEKNYIKCYKKMSDSEKIIFFNKMTIKGSSFIFSQMHPNINDLQKIANTIQTVKD